MTDNSTPKTLRESMVELKAIVECHASKHETFQKHMKAGQDRIETILAGDNEVPGLLTRVDRLEQDHKRWGWWIQATWGAVITLVIGWFVDRSGR